MFTVDLINSSNSQPQLGCHLNTKYQVHKSNVHKAKIMFCLYVESCQEKSRFRPKMNVKTLETVYLCSK